LSGKYSKWACQNCPDFKSEHICAGTWQVLEIRRLKQAGYPFGPDDLDYVSWQLLAALEEKLNMEKRKRELKHGG